jgi:DNA repair protein RadC
VPYARDSRARGRPTRSPMSTLARSPDPFEHVHQILKTIHSETNAQKITASLRAHFLTVENLLESSDADIRPFFENCSKTYCLIDAVRELIKTLGQDRYKRHMKISSFSQITSLLRRRLARRSVEVAWCLYFNCSNYLIHEQEVAKGTVNQVQIFPREIVKRSVLLNATAVVISHNHPSGEPEPSDHDIAVTDDLSAALSAVGIFLHDHIIIAEKKHFSFRQSMLLPMRQYQLPLSRDACSWKTGIRLVV